MHENDKEQAKKWVREGELSHNMCVVLPTDTNSDVWRCHQNLVLFSHPPSTSFTRSARAEEVGLGNYEATWLRVDSYLSKGGVLNYIMITFKYCLALLLLLSLHHPNAAIAIRLRS